MTTDAQLEAMCAQHVAGWTDVQPCGYRDPLTRSMWYVVSGIAPGENMRLAPPRYCSDPAAVIELLEKWTVSDKTFRSFDVTYASKGNYVVFLLGQIGGPYSAQAPTFAKAGVLALLRARGVEVEG